MTRTQHVFYTATNDVDDRAYITHTHTLCIEMEKWKWKFAENFCHSSDVYVVAHKKRTKLCIYGRLTAGGAMLAPCECS